jgi:Putative zinc-finger
MTCLMMTSLGVYVLGAADHEERLKVEAHLPHCASCRAELVRLAPIPGLLATVPPDAAPRLQRDAAAQHVAEPRGGRRFRPSGRLSGALAGLAACVAAAAVLIAGPWDGSSPARPGGHAAVTLSGNSRASHVHATARLLATSWGTSIRLTVRGVPLNVPCRLVVRSTAGGTETTGLWEAWREGSITVPASADWRPSDISSLAVMSGKRTLVTIKSAPLGPTGPPPRSGR